MDTANQPVATGAELEPGRLEGRFQEAVARAAGHSLSTYLVELREATQALAAAMRDAGRPADAIRTELIALAYGAATSDHTRRHLPTVLALVTYWGETPR